MLIKCPECGKEISDKSTQCIHCGFPLSSINNIKLSNEQCPLCKNNNHILKGINDVCSVCGYIFNVNEIKKANPDYTPYTTSQINKPHCPICDSTNVKKISDTSKAVSVAMFGIFSQKVKKQMHCNNCGYEW